MTNLAQSNKQLVQAIFVALATGNRKPFGDAMADDFCWRIPGSSAWSRSWEGKWSVVEDLMVPLFEQFATRYTNTARRFIAEGDLVVVECRGQVTTEAGAAYNNTYCYVCRLEDGLLKEVTEYMDTALAEKVLAPPPAPQARAIHLS